ITCEHATNAIPKRYTSHFSKNWLQLLQTHRGYDIGALSVAKALARKFRTKVIAAKVSRLLIDCNRSLHHQRVFSEAASRLSHEEKSLVVSRYYDPHRRIIEK